MVEPTPTLTWTKQRYGGWNFNEYVAQGALGRWSVRGNGGRFSKWTVYLNDVKVINLGTLRSGKEHAAMEEARAHV